MDYFWSWQIVVRYFALAVHFFKFNISFIALSLRLYFIWKWENNTKCSEYRITWILFYLSLLELYVFIVILINNPSLFKWVNQNSFPSCLFWNRPLYLFLFSFRKNLFDVFWRKTNWTLSQMGVWIHLTIHKQGHKKREIVVVNIF